MSGYTKGPWHVENFRGRANNMLRIVAGVGTKVGVARINAGLSEEHNARLIAAAPDLVAALEWFLDGQIDVSGTALILGDGDCAVTNKLSEIRNTLAKAKGGAS